MEIYIIIQACVVFMSHPHMWDQVMDSNTDIPNTDKTNFSSQQTTGKQLVWVYSVK